MTRINVGIQPVELTDQHLIAEHREIKRIPNCVAKGKYNMEGIPDKFKLGTGHVKFFYNKLLYLKFRYAKPPIEEPKNYIHKGIAKRSFELGYKIAPKFNLQKASAEMENGLLQVHIPFAESSKPTTLTIK